MNTALKTLILAAAGAALIAASPASAQTNKRTTVHREAPPVQNVLPRPSADLWQQGEVNSNPAVDQYGQIRDEYLKDDVMHNGNAY